MARFVAPDAAGLAHAGEELRAGRLIAFPTETVYGLGANALNPEAVLSIFAAKGRPLTDPLIVHVPTLVEAAALVELTPKAQLVFDSLARAFWPGPLTLIAPAIAALPRTVSANTGFVGLRCPAHPLAQQLLRAANVPVAAPSANRFGHVSPTTAQHVMDDLGGCDHLGILQQPRPDSDEANNSHTNEGNKTNEARIETGVRRVGIESTVVKIVAEDDTLIIFRRGGVSEAALARVLAQQREALGTSYRIVSLERESASDDTDMAQQAPGQLLTHYAPDVDTYLFRPEASEALSGDLTSETGAEAEATTVALDRWVVLDFAGRLRMLQDRVHAYRDLSASGDVLEASQRVFEYLRWAETVAPGHVARVVVTDVLGVAPTHEHAAALHDRMFRAASGKIRSLRVDGEAIGSL